jgi:hypothetical protein
MQRTITADGMEVYINPERAERGKKGAFVPTYRDREATQPWGWFCANCESDDVAVDTMERMVCNDCGNARRALTWDSGYL